MSITLSPELESELRRKVVSGEFPTYEAAMQRAISLLNSTTAREPDPPPDDPVAAFEKLEDWLASQERLPELPDKALTREQIYRAD